MIIEQLRSFLLTKSAVTSLVGQAIYKGRRQDHGGTTAITITEAGGPGVYDLDGEIGLAVKWVQLTLWQRGPVEGTLASLYEAMRIALSGFAGTWGTLSVEGCTFESGSGRDIPAEPPADGSKLWWQGRLIVLKVTFRQLRTQF